MHQPIPPPTTRERTVHRHNKRPLRPGTMTFGIAKPPDCESEDDLLQRRGGWQEFHGLRVLDSVFSVSPLYANDTDAAAAAIADEEDDDEEDLAASGGDAPEAVTDEERAAAEEVANALAAQEAEAEAEAADAAQGGAAHHHQHQRHHQDRGKRTGTRYENKATFPAASLLPFPLSVVCPQDSPAMVRDMRAIATAAAAAAAIATGWWRRRR